MTNIHLSILFIGLVVAKALLRQAHAKKVQSAGTITYLATLEYLTPQEGNRNLIRTSQFLNVLGYVVFLACLWNILMPAPGLAELFIVMVLLALASQNIDFELNAMENGAKGDVDSILDYHWWFIGATASRIFGWVINLATFCMLASGVIA